MKIGEVTCNTFTHGRSAIFLDSRKKVGLTANDTCEDCGVSRDTIDHEIFYCPNFNGRIRDNFINLLGDMDYKDAILFFSNIDAKENFRALVDT